MRPFYRHLRGTVIASLAGIALILCTGCLERTDEITVAKDGTTTIVAIFDGPLGQFSLAASLPSSPDWEVLEEKVDSSDSDKPRKRLVVNKLIPYGQPLPESYASPGTPEYETSLRFPTEIKMWREGNRTFYEFNRMYEARRHGRFNAVKGFEEDRELESRIADSGIFQVSEEDRTRYLSQLSTYSRFRYLGFLSEALGKLLTEGAITPSKKQDIEHVAFDWLKEKFVPDTILAVLSLEDDQIDREVNRLHREVFQRLVSIHRDQAAVRAGTDRDRLAEVFAQLDLETETTEAMDPHNFEISLRMPGELISTNGLISPEERDLVTWKFKGNELHDRSIPLYALFVLED
jgi:hypothetical protein